MKMELASFPCYFHGGAESRGISFETSLGAANNC